MKQTFLLYGIGFLLLCIFSISLIVIAPGPDGGLLLPAGIAAFVFTGGFLSVLLRQIKIQKKNNTMLAECKAGLAQSDARIAELTAELERLRSAKRQAALSGPDTTALESRLNRVDAMVRAAVPGETQADMPAQAAVPGETQADMPAQAAVPGGLPPGFSFDDLVKTNEFISENTKKGFDISDNLSGSAKAAFEISEKVQNGIQTITGALSDTLEFSEVLYKQSGQISDVIEILSDISAKINLLSINASIVSARAGAHGKTFEVVAREIRKLADQTGSSLSRIEEEIRGIQRVIGELVGKIRAATAESTEEKSALISVVGTLRGITLGVEVFRAVSKLAKEKASVQQELIQSVKDYCGGLRRRTDALESFHADMQREISELQDTLALIGSPRAGAMEEKDGDYKPA
jgi:hypothetical protein